MKGFPGSKSQNERVTLDLGSVMVKIKHCGSLRGEAAETLQAPEWRQWAVGPQIMAGQDGSQFRAGSPEWPVGQRVSRS